MIKERLLKKLESFENGFLEIKMPDKMSDKIPGNKKLSFGNPDSELKADIEIKDPAFLDLVISKGDIGLGEAYIENFFDTKNLINLLQYLTLNQKKIGDIFYGKKLLTFFYAFKNLLRHNNIKGSKKNIGHHYDLGNNFYSLWLDPSMTYSSAIFKNNDDHLTNDHLTNAQRQKYLRIINHLDRNGKEVLEIGCGWGGFMEEAAKSGFNVCGLTLSKEQLAFAQSRMASQKLDSAAYLKDYRHEQRKFDNIVSIEMFEAVGKKYWGDYFRQIKSCLKNNGTAVIQTITIDENVYEKYLKTSDYIREFIFPGGFLPCKSEFEKIAVNNNLQVSDKFEFGLSYEKTLMLWLKNFDAVKSSIMQLGFNEAFIRKWRFYLAYCIAGFRSKRIDVVQYCLNHI
jgi:cyclopropane-fatty-acyl-phospholipid synthase